MNKSHYLLLTLVVSLFFTPMTSKAIDPCSYISQTDAAAILGEEVKAPVIKKTAGFATGTSCTYFTAAPLAKKGGVDSISLLIYDAETMKKEQSYFTSPTKYFKKLHDAVDAAKCKDIEGLGDQAYWDESRLHILMNDQYFVLKINDAAGISSDKGRDDLRKKVAEHNLNICLETAHNYLFP